MKSELNISQRTKPDSRQAVQMRRMSKSSPGFEIGKTDLAPSKTDGGGGPLSISCRSQENVDKTIMAGSIGEKIENMTVENVDDNIQKILKQASAAGNQESAHLKEMLILHLGMIQHQQQLLLAKDRLIRTLAAEKDALKCRLERMERRMSLLKQKSDGVGAPLPSDIPGVTSESTLHLPVPTLRTPDKVNRRRHGDQRTPNRRILNTPNKDQGTPGKNRNKARVNNVLNSKVKKRAELAGKGLTSQIGIELRSKQPEASPIKIDKYDTNVSISAPSRVEFRLKPVKRKLEEVGEIVKTDKPFYVPCVDYKPLEVVAKVPESPNRKKRAKVEVPKWRFHPVSNCYALEGTENMEDEIYLKRHQKSENDEKRRKRWDIQRMREQRMYEKLKSGRYGASSPPKNKKNELVTTFCPILDEAKFLEITGDIPVNVFGYPLPFKKKNEFSLPWFDIAKREREEDRKEKEEKQKQQQSRFRKR